MDGKHVAVFKSGSMSLREAESSIRLFARTVLPEIHAMPMPGPVAAGAVRHLLLTSVRPVAETLTHEAGFDRSTRRAQLPGVLQKGDTAVTNEARADRRYESCWQRWVWTGMTAASKWWPGLCATRAWR